MAAPTKSVRGNNYTELQSISILLLCGSWTNTGKFSFESIINVPFPKVEVEDQDYHAMALEFLQLTCWISGFFFWLFALYLVNVVYVYRNLLWVSRPCDMQTWLEPGQGGGRPGAGSGQCEGGDRAGPVR